MENDYIGYVYIITNKVDGKVYIGKTTRSVEERWREHVSHCKSSNLKFSNAIKKYGNDSFLVETIDSASSDNELNFLECFYIEVLKSNVSGYNLTKGGEGVSGLIRSEETRHKLSLAGKGRIVPEERRERIRLSMLGKNRRPMSDAQKEQVRVASTGRFCSQETREKMSKARKGQKRTQEFKDRLSKLKTGVKLSEAHKDALSLAHKGKQPRLGTKHSDETKEKLREAHRRRKERGDYGPHKKKEKTYEACT
jgi:hypothetical protein